MSRVILGITGGIASGKSTVLKILSRKGIPTISSDDLAHRAIKKGTPAYRKIVQHFGSSILGAKREIDRQKLGHIVFAKPSERCWLEQTIHPVVIKELKRFTRRQRGLAALDIPLLFEARLKNLVHQVVVVYSTTAQQLQRLKRRNGLSKQDALRRIRAQIPLSRKRRLADEVLLNTGSRAGLTAQVQKLVVKWAKRKKS